MRPAALLDGANGGLHLGGRQGTGAERLGIDLTDQDVGNLPLLATDPYGELHSAMPPTGFPQVIMARMPQTGFRYTRRPGGTGAG